jgi:hypothetical protein
MACSKFHWEPPLAISFFEVTDGSAKEIAPIPYGQQSLPEEVKTVVFSSAIEKS